MPRQPSEKQVEEIRSALLENRRIEAIRIYREATGLGLKEAKEFIDGVVEELRARYPDRMPGGKGKGCLSYVLLVVAFAGLLCGLVTLWMTMA